MWLFQQLFLWKETSSLALRQCLGELCSWELQEEWNSLISACVLCATASSSSRSSLHPCSFSDTLCSSHPALSYSPCS